MIPLNSALFHDSTKYSFHRKHEVDHFHINLCIISLQSTTVRQLTQINGWIAVSLESMVPPAKKGAAAMKRTVSILTGASILQVSTVTVGIFVWLFVELVVCKFFFSLHHFAVVVVVVSFLVKHVFSNC